MPALAMQQHVHCHRREAIAGPISSPPVPPASLVATAAIPPLFAVSRPARCATGLPI